MLVALACLCSACGEDNETKGKNGKASDSKITAALDESEEEENGSSMENEEEGNTSDGDLMGNAVDDISADPSTDHVTEVVDDSDPQDPSTDPSDNGQSDPSGVPATQPSYLGAANLANGGFATGNGTYNYYIVHPEE
ncbi:MAG: hypothetical protein IKZ67_05635, partial [Paludibacteraceae bacterium]|nr:hypothetical protein [Paludibacteraceae bacterium]